MKKLSLNLEALQVESFTTAAEAGVKGTVRGNEFTYDRTCTCTDQQYTGAGAGCSEFASCLAGCTSDDGNSGWNTCGDGSDCTAGYSEWDGCTNNFKLCGW